MLFILQVLTVKSLSWASKEILEFGLLNGAENVKD